MAVSVLGDPLNVSTFGFILEYNPVGLATYGYIFPGTQDPDIIPDHSDRAVSLLIEQFEKKPLITGMLRAYVDQIQEIENELSDLLILRYLENAFGTQLDGIGDIVGIDRLGLDDAEYKSLIYFKIFVNSGQGEPETVIAALRFLTQSNDVHYKEIYPAAVSLSFTSPTVPDRLNEFIQGVLPAAVRLDELKKVPDGPFIFSSTAATPPDTEGLGFGNTFDSAGGKFSRLIT